MPKCLLGRSLTALMLAAMAAVLGAAPAWAQESAKVSRPWHYWIAPALLLGAILTVAAFGIAYYVRVLGGRSRR